MIQRISFLIHVYKMYYYTMYFEVGVGLLRTHFLEHALSSLPLLIQFVSNPRVWR